jgi:adenosine deaminase
MVSFTLATIVDAVHYLHVGQDGSMASSPAPTLDEVRAAPKVLLHDHLDGGLRPATILELADGIGWTPRLPSTDLRELAAWFKRGAETRDLLQYLATFEHTLAVMQTDEGIVRVAREAALDLGADGVVYAEVRFAPELHTERGLAMEAVVEAVQAGFRRGMAESAAAGHPIVVNTIICAMRTAQRSREVVDLALRMRDVDARIVAFDLAGAETGWPPSLHADALAVARANQLHITIHASEPPDLELIADGLSCGAERIGHGVRLLADIDPHTGRLGRLARSVLERQIPLELAPTCNVQIGAVPALGDHPIDLFRRLGMRATINTDNRLMSDVSVSGEVHACAQVFGWGWPEIAQVQRNAIESSFGAWQERRRLADDVIAPWYASR